MSQLVPCPACVRHIRATDSACPFCGVQVDLSPAGPTMGSGPRLGRAATFAFGAALAAAGAIGCESEEPNVPLYGAPVPVDAGPDGQVDEDAGETVAPLYGGPPEEREG